MSVARDDLERIEEALEELKKLEERPRPTKMDVSSPLCNASMRSGLHG